MHNENLITNNTGEFFSMLDHARFQISSIGEEHVKLIKQRDELLSVLKELQQSAAYWSDYDVPVGIVDRINITIFNAEH